MAISEEDIAWPLGYPNAFEQLRGVIPGSIMYGLG